MKENQFGVILEDIDNKLQRIAETMSTLATKEQLRELEEKVESVDGKIDTIEAAVTDSTKHEKAQDEQINRHEGRITELETA